MAIILDTTGTRRAGPMVPAAATSSIAAAAAATTLPLLFDGSS